MSEYPGGQGPVIVERGGSGFGPGLILGVILVLLILGAIWYFRLGPGHVATQAPGAAPSFSIPSVPAPSR